MEISTIENPIGSLVRKMENDFISGHSQTSKYVSESLYEDINRIEAYLNSKHISGEIDSLGRPKPFFNICLAKRNIWFRATDLDRKDIRTKANKSKDYLSSLLLNIHLQDWMRKDNFGQFLNDWGLYLASYNSAILKFVEKEGELYRIVMPWNRMIVDQIDFDSNPKIEILELTPAQLKKNKSYNQDIVKDLLDSLSSREGIDKQKKDNKNDYIKLYEIHGELPLSYLTGKDTDQDDYVQQMHVISFLESKERGKFDDFTLFSGKENKDPYMLTFLLPSTDGSISLNGSVKTLFDAQWMVNHTVKSIKDQLDLASKLIFQTSDGNFVGQNALSAIESGDILIHKPNEPLTQLQNNSHDIVSLQNYGKQWEVLAQDISSVQESMMGKTPPSGTAYRQVALVQSQALSNFDVMKQNKGLAIEEMFKKYITPFLLKKMDTTEEISATLDQYGIDKIDQMYISSEAVKRFNSKMVEAVIKIGTTGQMGEIPNLTQEQEQIKQELSQTGGQRFIKPSDIDTKTWKDIIGKFEGDIIYEITDENEDKQTTLTTLSNLLQTIGSNPMILQDSNAKMLFNKILNETGVISPTEINTISQPVASNIGGSPTGQINQNNQIKK